MRIKKGIRRAIIAIVSVVSALVLLSMLLADSFQFRMGDEEVTEYFKEKQIQPDLEYYTVEDRTIFYAATGPDTARMVVFIHGTPGSWTNFIDFLVEKELTGKYRLISIERPGFGNSDFGYPESSLEEQARFMKPVLELNRSGKLPIVVGHSLGGPIAAKMAIMYPHLTGPLILVAPSIAPDLEPSEPWRKYLRNPIFKGLVPTAIQVSNEEIYFLKQQLIDMLPEWKQIVQPVAVIQGGDDFLVDPGNARFAEEVLINCPVEIMLIEGGDHFIPWTAPKYINQAIDIVQVKEIRK